MTRWHCASSRVDMTEYRLADSEWRVISIMDTLRGRRVYKCYRGLALRSTKDTFHMAAAYCERDGKAYSNPWNRRIA